MTMADEVIIMRDGRIEQSGSPMEIYDHSNNLFVAQFIGYPGMNVIKCQVVAQGGTLYAKHEDTFFALPPGAKVTQGREIYYGVRPEHLRSSKQPITQSNRSDALVATPGTVRVVEPTGPEIHIYTKLGGNDFCAISRERVSWAPGDDIHLQPDLNHVHLFDGETEAAL